MNFFPIIAQTTVDAGSITLEMMQAAMAAGVATWIIPISCVVLLRIARKGTKTGGTIL